MPFLLLAILVFATGCSNAPTPTQAPTAPRSAQVPTASRVATPQPAPVTATTGRAFARQEVPLAQVLAESARTGRKGLLLFWTSWCGFCQRLERETLPDPRVAAAAGAYTAVRYDADRPLGKSLATRYGVRGYPTVVLVDAAGNKLDQWGGFNEPLVYAALLRELGSGK